MNDLNVSTQDDGRLSIQGLRIWSAVKGVKGYGSPEEGDTFTNDDLDAMVTAHKAVGGSLRPRLYPGHPLNPMLKMLARPQGEITDLRRDGNFLLADLKNVDPLFWKKSTQDGARLSPDVKLGHIDQRTGQSFPLSVVGVGVLGAVQPANGLLPALDDYQVHYYAMDDAQARAYSEGDVRSYAGEALPKGDAPSTKFSRALEVLRSYTAVPEAPQPTLPERQAGVSTVLISRKES